MLPRPRPVLVRAPLRPVMKSDPISSRDIGGHGRVGNTPLEVQPENPGGVDVITITPNNNTGDLSDAFLDPSDDLLTITSVTFEGAPTAAGLYTDGPFGIADGVVLATGDVTNALPPNEYGNVSTDFGLDGCEECDEIIPGYTTYDAAILTIEFDVDPACTSIAFDFIFGSDEYPEYVGTAYNDVFGAYLNGEQVAFDGDGNPITINGPFFSGPYVEVPPANGLEYDGSTYLLQSAAQVEPGSTGNILRIVVCDAGDHIYDAGVFLSRFRGSGSDPCTGIAPQFSFSEDLSCGDTLYAAPGEEISIDITAFDSGPNEDTVDLMVHSMPAGGVMMPALPLTGNPVSTMFTWTPDEPGVYAIDLEACDHEQENCQLCTPCRIYINVGQPPNGWVYGWVRSTADDIGLMGVPVKALTLLEDPVDVNWTDSEGYYAMELEAGTYDVTLDHMPLGYLPFSEMPVQAIVVGGDSVRVDFWLEEHCLDCEVHSLAYWRWQVQAALCDYHGMEYDSDDLLCILDKIHQRLAPYYLFLFDVNTLTELYEVLSCCSEDGHIGCAKAHFWAVAMNTVTGRMNTYDIVSEDGATGSQGIQYTGDLIMDGDPDNDETACFVARWMTREWELIPSGWIPPGLPQIAFKTGDQLQNPNEFRLNQNRPNPFNPVTEITFSLAQSQQATLTVYNIAGQVVEVIHEGTLSAGGHSFIWDGSSRASGVYFYRLKTSDFVQTRKMVLMK